jgi:hypothetical protein
MILISGLLTMTSCSKDDNNRDTGRIDTLTVNHSMKGYELYSWNADNQWHFSFLKGTNRLKSYEEVTLGNPQEAMLIQVTGTEDLKRVLDRFPDNELITWLGSQWLQSAWGGNYGNLQLPPQQVIDEIYQYCIQRNLQLQVAE